MKTLRINFKFKFNEKIYDVIYRYSNRQGFCTIVFPSATFTCECPDFINRSFHDYFHHRIKPSELNTDLITLFQSLF